jgi:hypothetical protein
MTQAICCGECSWPVPAELWNWDGNREEGAHCPGCRAPLDVSVFPAISRARSGPLPQALEAESEASCFYHTESRAVAPCDQCGRFLCGLCDIEMDGRHFCPACFNRSAHVETQRTLYDSIALALATFPLALFWPAIFGAPAALYVVIRRWNAPLSIVPRTRVRFYLAALFALAELAGAGFLIWAFVRVPRLGPS